MNSIRQLGTCQRAASENRPGACGHQPARFSLAGFLLGRLVAEAARQGNPQTISRRERSAFIVNEAIVPAVMKPIRSFAGGQAAFMLVLALVCAVVPPLGFTLTCGRVKPAQPPLAADLTRSRVA